MKNLLTLMVLSLTVLPTNADDEPKILQESNIVATMDMGEYVGVSTINRDNDYIYVNTGSRKVSKLIQDGNTFNIVTSSNNIGGSGQKIKCIAECGDYLYIAMRGNGSGMNNDTKFPEWLFSFEKGLDAFTNDFDLFDSYESFGSAYLNEIGEPSPARWNHSLLMHKGTGNASANHAILKKSWSIGSDAFLSLWIKEHGDISENVRIPVLTNGNEVALAIVINREKFIGLEFNGTTEFTTFQIGDQWNNVRINVSDSKATLYVRDWNLGDWTRVAVEGNLMADSIGMGIITDSENVEVLIDDFAYNSTNISDVMCRNGALVVLEKSTMKSVKTITFDMRALDIYIDKVEKRLYLGFIGGFNIYDISNPVNPTLLGYCHTADRSWTYPSTSSTSNYHFRAYGEEMQKIKVASHNGKKYLVSGEESKGVSLYDVTNPYNPFRISRVHEVPKVSCLNENSKQTTQPQYSQWGIVFEYPYIYSTVASYMTFQHNEYFDGKYTLLDDSDIVYGLMVIDISDLSNIKSKIIPLPKACYPIYINAEGDAQPTSICTDGQYLYANLSDKGLMIYSKSGMESESIGCLPLPGDGRASVVYADDDCKIYVGEGVTNDNWPDRHLFILDFSQTYDVTLSDAEFTTYIAPDDIDFGELSAYIVTEVNSESVTLTQVKSVPSGTPIIINAPEGTYTLHHSFTPDDVSGNLLIAGDGITCGDGKTIYSLGKSMSSGQVCFCLVAEGTVIPTDKAYITVTDGDAKPFISISGDTSSGINEFAGLLQTTGNYYDLNGRKQPWLNSGLNIVNGKVVLIK